MEQDREEVVKELLKNPSTDVHLENGEQISVFDIAMSTKNSKLLWELLGNYRLVLHSFRTLMLFDSLAWNMLLFVSLIVNCSWKL